MDTSELKQHDNLLGRMRQQTQQQITKNPAPINAAAMAPPSPTVPPGSAFSASGSFEDIVLFSVKANLFEESAVRPENKMDVLSHFGRAVAMPGPT